MDINLERLLVADPNIADCACWGYQRRGDCKHMAIWRAEVADQHAELDRLEALTPQDRVDLGL